VDLSGTLATPRQVHALACGFWRAGYRDRASRLQAASDILGRDVHSFSGLSRCEAGRLFGALDRLDRLDRPGAAAQDEGPPPPLPAPAAWAVAALLTVWFWLFRHGGWQQRGELAAGLVDDPQRGAEH
jgi:hypothetical protein